MREKIVKQVVDKYNPVINEKVLQFGGKIKDQKVLVLQQVVRAIKRRF
jgi:hypothetical protein